MAAVYPNAVSVSDFVSVQVVISPLAIAYESFGLPIVAGDSSVIDVSQRWRQYSSILQVANDFGTTAPEYLAAVAFFEQEPQPSLIYIGRWARTATPGILHGETLSAAQQVLTNFTGVTAGNMLVWLNGAPYNVSGLNFSTALNLNGVASTLQTALQGLLASTVSIWSSSQQRFDIVSPTTGVGSSVGFAQLSAATGYFLFAGQPTAGTDTITVDGTVVSFVSGTPSGNQVQVGSSLAVTLASLLSFLSSSADTNIAKMRYYNVGDYIYCVSVATGTTGNGYTLAESSSEITLSGGTLSGGASTATDVSTLLGFTAAAGATPVLGINAETPLACTQALANATTAWYMLSFAASVQPVDSDNESVAAYILASARSRVFGITILNASVLNSTITNDLASVLQASNNMRVFWQYSSQNPYCIMSYFGRIATVNWQGSNTAITLAYKQEPGIPGENLTETGFATLQAKGGNVNIIVNNGAVMIWPGQQSNGYWTDMVVGIDWLQNEIQSDVFNLLYTGTTTKIPQTDAGDALIASTIGGSCQQGITNGFGAPGLWNASGFGSLQQGDPLPTGYYVFYPPIASQSEALREERISVPFQVAFKLAGAVQDVDVILSINQ